MHFPSWYVRLAVCLVQNHLLQLCSFFLVCAGVDAHVLEERGALSLPQVSLPFLKVFRSQMYTIAELQKNDVDIYNWQKNPANKDPLSHMYQALHDYNVLEALHTYLVNKTVVGIMGGHAMKRNDSDFRAVALLCRELARKGFVVSSGGGPGAMEAANFGAYMAKRKFFFICMLSFLLFVRCLEVPLVSLLRCV